MSILFNYVDELLTPAKKQIDFMKARIKSIKNVFMHCSDIKPKEIHLGGSMAKGTMLRNKLDADIVFIYNRIKEVGMDWQKLAAKVYKPLKENFPNNTVVEAGNLAIHVKTSLDKQTVNFDIVPAYYVNSPKIMATHTGSKLYAAITTIWHSRYLERHKNYPYFTHVARLLKDWKSEQDVPFLKSIHLELITADVYDNIVDDTDNLSDLDEVLMYCFENIIDTLDGYPVIPCNWKYCNEKDFEEQYNFPVLIDPANPRDNLLENISKTEIKKIRNKLSITIDNLQEGYYADIFNRRNLTEFFD